MDALDHVHTERLCLREPSLDDLEVVHRIQADPATNVYNPAGPVRHSAQTQGMIEDWRQARVATGFGYWTVRESCDGPLIGVGGLTGKTIDGVPVLNLYYRFTPEAWGQGYATELAVAALNLASSADPPRPVVAVCREANAPSRRVAERAGLVPAGTTLHNGAPSLVYESPEHPLFSQLRI